MQYSKTVKLPLAFLLAVSAFPATTDLAKNVQAKKLDRKSVV